jgi:hypothetical protein
MSGRRKSGYLRVEHVGQSGAGSFEGDAAEEEDGQHDVREQGREVDHLEVEIRASK